jgi:hypothetical protein
MRASEPEILSKNCETGPAAESSDSIKKKRDLPVHPQARGSGAENFAKVQESLLGDAVAAMV